MYPKCTRCVSHLNYKSHIFMSRNITFVKTTGTISRKIQEGGKVNEVFNQSEE